ncbi:MAG: porin [Bacteroidota bacterium]
MKKPLRATFGITLLILLSNNTYFGQNDSIKKQDTTGKIILGAYIENYYAYDIDAQKNQVKQPFYYNHAQRNEINLNLGMIKIGYSDDNHRGQLSLMTGHYAQYNLAAEPVLLQNIYEASVGFKIKKNLWLDVGVFPSHIGYETAIGKDNITLTRSLIAENSPYFETGAKLNYDKGGKWAFTFLILNGWQNIKETNGDKALGTLITFKPTTKLTINSCSFAGNEKADTAKQYRLFHDLNFVWNPSDKFSMVLAMDIGVQQQVKVDSVDRKWDAWHGGSLQFRYSPSKKINMGLRFEEYWDKNMVIVTPTTVVDMNTGAYRLAAYNCIGASLNFDYKPFKNVMWRTEAKYMKSDDSIFYNSDGFTDNKTTFTTALLISF